jgi:hypothetical protein
MGFLKRWADKLWVVSKERWRDVSHAEEENGELQTEEGIQTIMQGFKIRGSSVRMATGYGMDDRGIRVQS